jgi:hypothetical protein
MTTIAEKKEEVVLPLLATDTIVYKALNQQLRHRCIDDEWLRDNNISFKQLKSELEELGYKLKQGSDITEYKIVVAHDCNS